ncbi:hypothetical protein HYH02_007624 [Chlamydomonas schloesseri]|uniref:Kinesin motor domain-containing protein n=1 Tax=Chlamydomonas schloesseri TaxID=2026947 RepID=A0A836B4T1_9CHLO|nr:hypothetical protein HYH02_007624 [Chlamydomonas schloesseri]|eukprot:KAG2447294.1 hypothetical protein HYH02_007624 [Chlamydomonas schloesseri]
MAEAKPGPGPGENDGVNVNVLLRCRPLSDKEIAERTPQVISCNEALREATLYVQGVGGKQTSKTFRFDRVFSPEASQEKLFKQAIVPIVQEVMEGFNCTIFAYGQTGTGKTYTMEGGPRRSDDGKVLSAEAGVIPRSIKQIFDTIEANNTDSTVKVTFLELYNEELTDLLSTFDDGKEDAKRLRLLEDRSGVVVQGLEEVVVKSAAEIYQVLDRGTAKRRTAETLLNKRSSRSHSVFSITIHMREVTPEGEDVVKVGKLNLVDLAGSENISRSGAKDGRAREAGSINQSLLTLGRVITALVEHSGHVPYRDSKLTRLLRESLGGKTKTCIIATIAPTVQCQEETISTLDYAHRAKNIRNRPEVNQKISKTAMIKEMSSEMEKLRMELIAQREKNGIYIPTEKFHADELERVQLRDTVKALREEMKLEQEEFAATLEQQKAESDKAIGRLQSELSAAKADLEYMDARLQEASRTIHERQYIITAQRAAEQEVADAAEVVRSELEAAAADVGELFASLEELSDVHSGDRDTIKRVQSLVAERLGGLGSKLTGAAEGQRRQLAGLGESLASFRAQKAADLQQLLGRVAAVQDTVATMRDAVERQAQAAEAAASGALGRINDATGSHVAAAVAAAQGLEAATRGAVNALAQAMEQQSQQLMAFTQQQAATSEAACEALREAMGRLSGRFEGVQAAADQAGAAVEESTAALGEGLGSFAERYKESCVAQQAALMVQITALVAAFTEQRASEVAREVTALKQQAVEGGEAVRRQLSDISGTAASARKEVQETESSVVSSLQSQQGRVQEATSSLTASLKGTHDQAWAIHTGVAGQLATSITAQEAFNKGMGQACSSGMEAVQGAVRACVAGACEAAASAAGSAKELSRSLEEQTEASAASADTWAAACSTLDASITDACGQQVEGMSALAAETESLLQQRLDVQRALAPPAQRDFNVPPATALRELRCPAEDKLVARCHAEFPQVFAAGMAAPSSPRSNASAASSPPLASGGENVTPLPPQVAPLAPQTAGQQQATGSVPPSPRTGANTGMRSRIPSKPSLIPSSPATGKDLPPHVTSRQQLADKTNNKQSSILADW